METSDKDWGRIYPNIITWLTTGKENKPNERGDYHLLSWVRFWREGKEYQMPIRMDVDGVETLEQGAQYDEKFHEHCWKVIRHHNPTGDFKEAIKLNDKHVITINYKDDVD